MNSSKFVYSIYYNVIKSVSSKKDIIYKQDIMFWDRVKDYSKTISKRVYNDIENGKYTHDQMILFLLVKSIFERVSFFKVNEKNVKAVVDLFSDFRFKRDKQFLIDVNKKVKLPFKKYFVNNVNGYSILYDLIINDHISPRMWIEYEEKFYVKSEHESKEHEKFRWICNKIKEFNFKKCIGG